MTFIYTVLQSIFLTFCGPEIINPWVFVDNFCCYFRFFTHFHCASKVCTTQILHWKTLTDRCKSSFLKVFKPMHLFGVPTVPVPKKSPKINRILRDKWFSGSQFTAFDIKLPTNQLLHRKGVHNHENSQPISY